MRRHNLQTIGGVDPRIIPPKGATRVGEVEWGGERKTVYEETFTEYRKVPLVIDGEEQWRKNPQTGQPVSKIHKLEPHEVTREYILVASPNGQVRREFNFREDPEVIERQKREAAAQEIQEELAAEMVERGLSVGELLDQIGRTEPAPAGSPPEPPEEATEDGDEAPARSGPPMVEVEGLTATMAPGGRWTLPTGDVVQGTKEEARAALEKLVEASEPAPAG